MAEQEGGPCTPRPAFGLAGTATEVLADHAARLAPLTDHDVHDLITAPHRTALRSAPLLCSTHEYALPRRAQDPCPRRWR